jgi:hypothetical protein
MLLSRSVRWCRPSVLNDQCRHHKPRQAFVALTLTFAERVKKKARSGRAKRAGIKNKAAYLAPPKETLALFPHDLSSAAHSGGSWTSISDTFSLWTILLYGHSNHQGSKAVAVQHKTGAPLPFPSTGRAAALGSPGERRG